MSLHFTISCYFIMHCRNNFLRCVIKKKWVFFSFSRDITVLNIPASITLNHLFFVTNKMYFMLVLILLNHVYTILKLTIRVVFLAMTCSSLVCKLFKYQHFYQPFRKFNIWCVFFSSKRYDDTTDSCNICTLSLAILMSFTCLF